MVAGPYLGVPLSSLRQGENVVQTGSAGPTRGSDYNFPVSIDGQSPVGPDDIIPPGTTLHVWVPPGTPGIPGGGATVVTGTQIPLDAATIAHYAATDQNAATQTANQAAQAAASLAEQHAQFLATMEQNRQQLAQQYEVDKGRLGLDTANSLFSQRMQAFNAQLAQANQNFQQQATKAGLSLDILKALADRSGPQDWVKYNNLLNDLSSPSGQTTRFDPMSILNGLQGDTNFAVPGTVQPTNTGTGLAGGIQTGPTNPAAGPVSVPGTANPGAPGPSTAPPANPYGNDNRIYQTPIPGVTGGAAPMIPLDPNNNFGALGPGGASRIGDWYRRNGIPQMAQGGMAPGGMAVVGDSPNGRENQEMAFAPNGPLVVIPLHGSGPQGAPHAAEGGIFQNYQNPYPGLLDYQTALQQRTGTGARAGAYQYQFGGEPGFEAPARPQGMKGAGGAGTGLSEAAVAPAGPVSFTPTIPLSGPSTAPAGPVSVPGSANPGAPGPSMAPVIQGAQPGPVSVPGTMVNQMAGPGAALGETYGMPAGLEWTKYSPAQLGAQPFIQKLQGMMPSREFGAFGATLSNPAFGIYNMPSNINLQTYRDLLPSERDQTLGLYQDALGVDFRDLLEQARRATIGGRTLAGAGYAA